MIKWQGPYSMDIAPRDGTLIVMHLNDDALARELERGAPGTAATRWAFFANGEFVLLDGDRCTGSTNIRPDSASPRKISDYTWSPVFPRRRVDYCFDDLTWNNFDFTGGDA